MMKAKNLIRIKNFIKGPRVAIPILIYLILLGPIFYLYFGSPPKTEVQVSQGVWLPFTFPTYISSMKSIGVNTVFIQDLGPLKELLVANIKTAHRNGMRVALTTGFMEPYPKPSEIDIEALNSRIIEVAKLAEKYGVEFFAPINELDCIFLENSTSWGQEILIKIKEVYHGEVIWKGGLFWEIADGRMSSEDWPTNFTGYDYIGFGITPRGNMTLEDYSQFVDKVLNVTLAWAERDKCNGVMVTEFGVWEWGPYSEDLGRQKRVGHSEEEIARAYEIVFERGKDRVVGFFPYGMRWDIFGEKGIYGEAEKVIKKWYKEIL